MQVGTRWAVGTAGPSALPEVVALAVETAEQDLVTESVDTAGWFWTLTWLEGAPVVELDDGTVIRYDRVADSATMVLPADTLDDPFDDED